MPGGIAPVLVWLASDAAALWMGRISQSTAASLLAVRPRRRLPTVPPWRGPPAAELTVQASPPAASSTRTRRWRRAGRHHHRGLPGAPARAGRPGPRRVQGRRRRARRRVLAPCSTRRNWWPAQAYCRPSPAD